MNLDLKNFNCILCQACCRETGYVRLKKEEPEIIADFLGMDVNDFIETLTRLTRDRQGLALVDQAGGACIFLSQKGCRINPVKPIQCRDFPHKWKFSEFEQICGWAKKAIEKKDHKPKIPRPSSSSK